MNDNSFRAKSFPSTLAFQFVHIFVQPLTSTRCDPDRLVSVHPSRFSAASTRAAFAMDSTVERDYDNVRRRITECLVGR